MNDYSDLSIWLNDKIDSFPKENQKVMVAMSGGVDSTVLFDVFCQKKIFKKILNLSVCHINFGLRAEESDLDEAFITELAAAKNAQAYIHKIDPSTKPDSGESTQAWARRMRYNIFESYAQQGWTIVLAHHQDDVAENILLRLARGASPIGLIGMSEWNEPYWRPFLNIKKKDLVEWAIRHKLPHREDSSNATMDYSRNVIRHTVLPALEALYAGSGERIARFGSDVQELSQFARSAVNLSLSSQQNSLEETELSIPSLLDFPAVVIVDQVSAFLMAQDRPHSNRVDSNFLEMVLENILDYKNQNKWVTAVPGGGYFSISDEKLCYSAKRVTSKHRYLTHSFHSKYFLAGGSSLSVQLPNIERSVTIYNHDKQAHSIQLDSPQKKKNTDQSDQGSWFFLNVDNKLHTSFSAERIVSAKIKQAQRPSIEVSINNL